MGSGGYIFCEWDSIEKEVPLFRDAFKRLEADAILKCTNKWFPKLTPQQACGYLMPKSGEQFGRTSILPTLFRCGSSTAHVVAGVGQQFGSGLGATPAPADWRQLFITAEHQELLAGSKAGNTIPEDFIIALIGFAFPNQQQHITEIKWQIGDRKYGRLNLEDMRSYNKPALVLEEGVIIDEEQSFELYGYVEGPIPIHHDGWRGVRQRIIPLGAAYYKVKDKVLGAPGSTI